MHSCILVNPCMQTAHTRVHVKYSSKFHPNKIHTYRLTYSFPLHLFSKILSVVFIEHFHKLGLFKLLWNLILSLEPLIES